LKKERLRQRREVEALVQRMNTPVTVGRV